MSLKCGRIEYTPCGELWIEQQTEGMNQDGATLFRFTGKELDQETGFYYYGARYLNPKTSMWISADPAMGDYVPRAPADDEAKKHNERLPGMGGVYNYVNFHVYHYAGNNPVKYTDLDGRDDMLSGFAMEIFKKEWDNFVDSFNDPEKRNAAIKKVIVETARDGAKISEKLGDAALGATIAGVLTGDVPFAVIAGGVGTTADVATFFLNLIADAVEGDGYNASASTFASVLVDLIGSAVAPKFVPGSQRFHRIIGTGRGRFISSNVGKTAIAGVPVGAKITAKSIEFVLTEKEK